MILGYAKRFGQLDLTEAARVEILVRKFGAAKSATDEGEAFESLTFQAASKAAVWATGILRIEKIVELDVKAGIEFVEAIAKRKVTGIGMIRQILIEMPVQAVVDAGSLVAEIEDAEQLANLVAWYRHN